ncbi:MAG: hypothetical protein HXY34_10795 [Candidatus Thorarchaeota archaeon]|nr:hypothetical protein [Candidatus Thorarchaeota archaeon]
MTHTVLKLDQLMAFLNWLYMQREEVFELEVPYLKKPVLKVEIPSDSQRGRVHSIITQSDFGDLTPGSSLKYDDILTCLLASGVVQPVNWSEATQEIEGFVRRDLTGGERFGLIAFDTNALMFRCYSLFERHTRTGQSRMRSPTYGYLLSSGVQRELAPLEFKYKQEDISKMKDQYQCAWFDFRDYLNQPGDNQRRFWLGRVEAANMQGSKNCVKCESELPTSPKEKGGDKDLVIIDSLVNHSKRQNVDAMVISYDDQFVATAHQLGLRGIRLDRPATGSLEHSTYETEWTAIRDLIYVFSVLFGAVRAAWQQDEWTLFQGIWPGKKEENWMAEEVSVSTDDPRLSDILMMARRLA